MLVSVSMVCVVLANADLGEREGTPQRALGFEAQIRK